MFKSLMKTGNQPLVTPERMPQETTARPAALRRPAVRISETDAAFDLQADMPGVKPDAVEVVVERGILTLRGTASPAQPERAESIWREFDGGTFERTFELPAGIDADGITATTANGQVRLTLPKQKAAQPRRIEVKMA